MIVYGNVWILIRVLYKDLCSFTENMSSKQVPYGIKQWRMKRNDMNNARDNIKPLYWPSQSRVTNALVFEIAPETGKWWWWQNYSLVSPKLEQRVKGRLSLWYWICCVVVFWRFMIRRQLSRRNKWQIDYETHIRVKTWRKRRWWCLSMQCKHRRSVLLNSCPNSMSRRKVKSLWKGIEDENDNFFSRRENILRKNFFSFFFGQRTWKASNVFVCMLCVTIVQSFLSQGLLSGICFGPLTHELLMS